MGVLSNLAHLHAYVVPAAAIVAAAYGGWLVWLPAILILVVHPLADAICGRLKSRKRQPSTLATLMVLAYPPLQLIVVGAPLFGVLQGVYSPMELLGLTISTGLVSGGIGITVAHELVHRSKRWQRGLGLLSLAAVNYMHFRVAHVYGHHKTVATIDDPASAPRGMSVYEFYPQSIIGGYVDAWRIEAKRARSRGQSPWNPLANRTALYTLLQTGAIALVGTIVGWPGALYYMGQSLVAIHLLETINYVEHYGLERKRKGDAFEAQTEAHSWDTDRRLTNWMTFNLGLHADHHMSPLKPYETLASRERSPQLPAGYSTMMWLALVPPLWRRVMDPLTPQ